MSLILFYYFCFHFAQCVEYQKEDYAAIQTSTSWVSPAAITDLNGITKIDKCLHMSVKMFSQIRPFHHSKFSMMQK